MGKYLKSFEDLKTEFIRVNGESVDLLNDNEDVAIEFGKRSRFGRNPMSNILEYENRRTSFSFVVHHADGSVTVQHTTQTRMSFDDFVERFVCRTKY